MVLSSGVTHFVQIVPVIGSVGAVLLWGVSDFTGGYASRRANAFVLTAFAHLCAFVWMTSIAVASHGAFPSGRGVAWAIAAGAVGGFALAIFYRALASGQMGLTAPVGALIGAAIPTLADIGMEGAPSRWTIAGFVLAILAIWLITRPEEQTADKPAGVAMAALAGVGFAGFYLCIHQANGSPVWAAAISRIGSFTATGIAVLVTRAPIKLNATGTGLGVLAGFLDISGTALFIFASQHGRLDEAVVISSLYPAITVLLARVVLREHFSRWRFVGLLAALAAVPLIAAG